MYWKSKQITRNSISRSTGWHTVEFVPWLSAFRVRRRVLARRTCQKFHYRLYRTSRHSFILTQSEPEHTSVLYLYKVTFKNNCPYCHSICIFIWEFYTQADVHLL
jgi:hypothetical protein